MISVIRDADDSDERFSKLDFRRLSFPSDGLTLGVLRTMHSDLFDKGFAYAESAAQPQFFIASDKAGHAGDVLGNMLFIERLIATAAFASARGIDGPRADVADYKEELASLYQRYSLAKGEHHAALLIRDIERQGATLAQNKSP